MSSRALALGLLLAGRVASQSHYLQLFTCVTLPTDNGMQTWNITPPLIKLVAFGKCIDVQNYGTTDQSEIYTYDCHPEDKDPTHQNQEFTFFANGTIGLNMAPGMCLDVSNYGTDPGSQVWLYHQTGNTNQQWITRPFGGGVQIVNPASGLCLDAGSALPPPCAAGQPAANLPICNASLPLPERVASVVSNLSQAESIPLFNTASKGVVRLGINPWEWWSEALHGVANSPGVHFTNAIPGATSFPQVCTTAMAFNRTLWHGIGATISTEARAMNNNNQAGLTFWAPNINIFRDPRWGRGQETPGEVCLFGPAS